jgi:hypothetical protein
MKKLFFLPAFLFLAFGFSSCEDEDLSPLPEQVSGQYMRLDIDPHHRQLNSTDLENTYFGGMLSNPSGTVVRYELFVRRRDGSGFLTGDYLPMLTVNSFPYDLRITPQMIATAVGIEVSDLDEGDVYTFFAYSYDANGHRAGYANLARINQVTNTMEQGYKFNTDLTPTPKPFDSDDPYNNHQAAP